MAIFNPLRICIGFYGMSTHKAISTYIFFTGSTDMSSILSQIKYYVIAKSKGQKENEILKSITKFSTFFLFP